VLPAVEEGAVLEVAAVLGVVAVVAEEVSRRTRHAVRAKDSHEPAILLSTTKETTVLAVAATAATSEADIL